MRLSPLVPLLLLALSACGHSRFTRTPQESLMSTIRDPLAHECGTLGRAGDYCGIPRAGAPPLSAKQRQCVRFYQATLDAANIQCNYEEEVQALHRSGERSHSSYIADRLRQIHLKYHRRATRISEELEESYRGAEEWSDEQELTYHNVGWSLKAFTARVRLESPASARKPASAVTDESLGRLPTEATPELMRKLVIPAGPAK